MNFTGKKKWVPPETAGRLRDIPLVDVMTKLGGTLLRRSAWEHRCFYIYEGQEITIHPGSNAYCHTEHTEPSGRGAISFLMAYTGRDYMSACRFLDLGSTEQPHPPSFSPSGRFVTKDKDRAPGCVLRQIPVPYRSGWTRVRTYLEGRGLSRGLLEDVHEAGLLYADGDRAPRIVNAVFRCSDSCAFVRGTYDPPPPREPYKRTYGRDGDLAPFVWGPEDAQLTYIVESPISGLSLIELDRRATLRIVALAGRGLSPSAPAVRAALRGQVVAATDADLTGDQIASEILVAYSTATRLRPKLAHGKDWNDQLREERANR